MTQTRIVVEGLSDFQRGLKELSADARLEMNKALKGIAEAVAVDARRGVPRKSGRASASYKARGGAKGASIAFGGPKAPHAPWLDFGGVLGPSGRRYNTQRNRPPVGDGRYLYPAIVENGPMIQEAVFEAIDTIGRKYGMGVE